MLSKRSLRKKFRGLLCVSDQECSFPNLNEVSSDCKFRWIPSPRSAATPFFRLVYALAANPEQPAAATKAHSPFRLDLPDYSDEYFFRIAVPYCRSDRSIIRFRISFFNRSSDSPCSSRLIFCAGVSFTFGILIAGRLQSSSPCFRNQTRTVLLPWIPYSFCACLYVSSPFSTCRTTAN